MQPKPLFLAFHALPLYFYALVHLCFSQPETPATTGDLAPARPPTGDHHLTCCNLLPVDRRRQQPLAVMGTMYKNKKAGRRHGPPREHGNMQDQAMDIRKIMKEVEIFSYSHMTWKERKKIENRKVVSLGGKSPKNQRFPLSVARPMMKKQKEREQKMLQERLILGEFGGKHGGSSKRSVGKHKPEDRGLKAGK